MKKFYIIFIAALFANFAALAQEKDQHSHKNSHGDFGLHLFNKMDLNKDGVVTKEELVAHHKNSFDKIDTNHDGIISRLEAKAAKTEKGFDDAVGKKDEMSFEESLKIELKRFEEADHNHDKKGSKEEWKKHYLKVNKE